MSTTDTRSVRILDDRVVNQIAAGEVVERPASVVKELVENSLDAGADDITVVIANGGRTHIEVIDNGSGMTKHDALLAIERFGTSKISRVEDLESIGTHGFRGEALPSIASVSRLRLLTSPAAAPGVQLSIDGGQLREVNDVSAARGTRVEVRQLFYNVPARRKFLRSENTESGNVRALLIDFAIAYPHVRFKLIVDGTESALYVPGRSFAERVEELKLAGERPFRADETTQLAAGELRVRAVLSQPVDCVTSSGRLRLLVNKRSVRDKLLLKAARDGFGNFLRPGRYPTGVLSIDLPSTEVDVNVHPQKTEVRFRRPEIIFGAVTKAIRTSLLREQPESSMSNMSEPAYAMRAEWPAVSHSPPQVGYDQPLFADARPEPTKAPRLDQMRFVGQIMACYLIFEGAERLALVDMHAAHERVTFYRLKCQLRGGGVHSQQLLIPEKLTLSPDRIGQFDRFQSALSKLGIDADLISESAIVVRSVPAILGNVSAQAIFSELNALPEWTDWGDALENAWDGAISRLACHGSVRSGRELEPAEAYELVAALAEADASGFCPHGRPIAKFFSRAELERMFGRIDF